MGGTLVVGRYVLFVGRAISVGGAAAFSSPIAWAALGTAGLTVFAHSRGAPLPRVLAVAVTPFALAAAHMVYEDGEQSDVRVVRLRSSRLAAGALGTPLLKQPRLRGPVRDAAAAGAAAATTAATTTAKLPMLADARDVAPPAGARNLRREFEVEWREGPKVRRGVLRVQGKRDVPWGRWELQRVALKALDGCGGDDCYVFDLDRVQIAKA